MYILSLYLDCSYGVLLARNGTAASSARVIKGSVGADVVFGVEYGSQGSLSVLRGGAG